MWIKVLSIISVLLQFITFPLAAPEILGKEWLKRTELLIRNTIKGIPNLLLAIMGFFVGYYLATGINIQNRILIISMIVLMVIMFVFRKRIAVFFDKKIAVPILNKLIISDDFRFTLLKTAAIFFTIAFILQIIIIVHS